MIIHDPSIPYDIAAVVISGIVPCRYYIMIQWIYCQRNETYHMNDDITEEKKGLEEENDLTGQNITEADEAAGSAEGMSDAEDNILTDDVPEDRDAIPAEGLDVQEEDITR